MKCLKILVALFLIPSHSYGIGVVTCPTDQACVDYVDFVGANLNNLGNYTMLVMFRLLAQPAANRNLISKSDANTHRYFVSAVNRLNFGRTRVTTQASVAFSNTIIPGVDYRLACSWNASGTAGDTINCAIAESTTTKLKVMVEATANVEGVGALNDDAGGGWRLGGNLIGPAAAYYYFEISSGALTVDECEEKFRQVKTTTGTLLQAWNMYASSPTVFDHSGNGYNGTMRGIELGGADYPINYIGGPQ